MAKKRQNHVRVTVTVPAETKRGMDKASDTNWSAIAAAAFRSELESVAERKKGLDMNAVRERLRASRDEARSGAYSDGRQAGDAWARSEAGYRALAALDAFRREVAPDSPGEHIEMSSEMRFADGHSWWGDVIASRIVGGDASPDQLAEFWEVAFGDDFDAESEGSLGRVAGFVDGALAIYDAAGIS